jgi:hypothetical protein
MVSEELRGIQAQIAAAIDQHPTLTRSAIARELGVHRSFVTYALDPKSPVQFETLRRIAQVVGIEVKPVLGKPDEERKSKGGQSDN